MHKKDIYWFQTQLAYWFDLHGRKHLPWQNPVDPYRVWISEIMLQQTQVDTVIPYFEKFIRHFPDIEILSLAKQDEVLYLWSGLGYYARARNLHKTARLLVDHHDGQLPSSLLELMRLPGIGRSTAGAIFSLGFKQSAAILDGNVKRILSRFFTIKGWPGKASVQKQLWLISTLITPEKHSGQFNQAMMDIGSLICKRTKPLCSECPLSQNCQAYIENTTAEFPFKKPFKKIPEKKQTFLFIENEQKHILLIKRPPTGIWGALWCFPQAIDLSNKGLHFVEKTKITEFSHPFTHFTMKVDLILAQINNFNTIMDANDLSWYDPQHPHKIGLAAPVSQQLLKLTKKQHDDSLGKLQKT